MKNSDVIEKYKTAGQGPCVTHVMDLHEGVIGTSNMPSRAAYVKRVNTLHKRFASLKKMAGRPGAQLELAVLLNEEFHFPSKGPSHGPVQPRLCTSGIASAEMQGIKKLPLSWEKKPTNIKSSVMLCKNKCHSYNNKYLVWVNTNRE